MQRYCFIQITFEAIKGFGYLGDIAIDQIAFSPEKCSLVPSFASPNSSGVGKAIFSIGSATIVFNLTKYLSPRS